MLEELPGEGHELPGPPFLGKKRWTRLFGSTSADAEANRIESPAVGPRRYFDTDWKSETDSEQITDRLREMGYLE
jgi:hypothetical protein